MDNINWDVKDGQTLGYTDASDLGWKAGQWPFTHTVDLGGAMVCLTKSQSFGRDGELEGYQYVGWIVNDQVVLTVYND